MKDNCLVCLNKIEGQSYIQTPDTAKVKNSVVCFNCAFSIAVRLQFKVVSQLEDLQKNKIQLLDELHDANRRTTDRPEGSNSGRPH